MKNYESKKSERKDTQQHEHWHICIGGREVNKSIRPANQPLETKEQLLHAFRNSVIDDQMEEKLEEFLKNNN